jgi:thiosulfate/3-mercaptopyruvate sulfurtransferase
VAGGRAIPHVVAVDAFVALVREPDVRVVDVRWRLGDAGAGRRAFDAGHIPGAVFADLDADLASAPGDRGRHPLPSPAAFVAAMARLGVVEGTRVVAYDDQGGAIAARLWFLLRYFGHETCAVLDGGIGAYTADGHRLATLDTASAALRGPAVHPLVARPRPELVVTREAVAAAITASETLVLDARAGERFRGESEPVDPRAGHIPSAVNAPFGENLSEGRFRSADELRAHYGGLGAFERETVVYCGSGVTACHDLLALAVAGNDSAKLYAGSWSEWARDPSAPIATGA